MIISIRNNNILIGNIVHILSSKRKMLGKAINPKSIQFFFLHTVPLTNIQYLMYDYLKTLL